MILLIDNYDSFTYNLARYCWELEAPLTVKRPEDLSSTSIRRLKPSHIIISPGPCDPGQAPLSNKIISTFYRQIPILGVCLGHQCIAYSFGGKIVRAPRPFHGKVSSIFHQGHGIFKNLPSPFNVTRYHSLIVDEETLSQEFLITARTNDHIIMGLEHRLYPLFGVQFHPEAHLSQYGYHLLKNFLSVQ